MLLNMIYVFSNCYCYICNNFLMIAKYSPWDFLSPPENNVIGPRAHWNLFYSQGLGSTRPRIGSNSRRYGENLVLANSVTKLCAILLVWSGQNCTRRTVRITAGRSGTGSPPASPAPPSTSPPCCPVSSSTTTTRDQNISTQAVSIRKFGPNNTNLIQGLDIVYSLWFYKKKRGRDGDLSEVVWL